MGTHASTTDPDSRLFRKGLGKEAKLSYMGHVVTENRNGFVVEATALRRTSQEWDAAIEMLEGQRKQRRQTVGSDKGYDVGRFVGPCRELGMTPHVASREKGSRIDGRTTNHLGLQSTQAQTGRRLEDIWIVAQTSSPRRAKGGLVVPIHGDGLQHYSIAWADGMNSASEPITIRVQGEKASNASQAMPISSSGLANETSILNPNRVRSLITLRNPNGFHQISTGC